MPFSASAVTNPNPGSPVFSPSRRLPPSLLSFSSSNKDTPEPHHHIHTLPGSPLRLRPPSLLRAQHQHRREVACSPSPCKPTSHQQFAAVTTTAITPSPSRLVNRRRPPPLLVPAVTTLQEQEQQEEAGHETQETAGHGFAAYCRKGKGRRRIHMEDRHVAAVGLGGDPHTAFFGVFDGHGGKAAAEFAANNMPRIMAQELLQQQQQTRTCSTNTTTAVEEAVRRAYLRTDADFSSTSRAGGACSVTALLRKDRLVVSNAGDCRAVLCRAGKANPLTSDHRASREDERRRIESQGGFVIDCRGTWRVQGSLAVSRGIGDGHLKPWVLAEPDTTTLPVDADCEFLVLASDGLWDKVDAQEAVDVARPLCCTGGQQLSAACRRLVELAASRGSTDDITVLIVSLSAMSDDLYL